MSSIASPAARAVHSLRNALMILGGLVDRDNPHPPTWEQDVRDAVALVGPVLADIAALHQDTEAKDARIADLLETGMASALYIDRLEQKNTALNEALIAANRRTALAHQELEHLYIGASMDLERHTTRFNAVVRLRTLLDAPATDHTETPRAAAGAR